MTIYFYTTKGPYGWLSNFSKYGFELDGKYWPTVEHYFQARKFDGSCYEDQIRRARTPREAKKLARDNPMDIRPDWEDVKDDVMGEGVLKKFETHDDLRELLLSTGYEKLIESAPNDYYWGCGADGTGKNMLGKILMEIREHFMEKEDR